MIDISDGLLGDAAHIAAASGVAAIVDIESIPIHEAVSGEVRDPEAARHLAASGGEDYELLFAAKPRAVQPVAVRFAEAFGISLTRVGTVEEGSGVYVRTSDGAMSPAPASGFQHFGGA
jgi:thiamine-monophosphate kinase